MNKIYNYGDDVEYKEFPNEISFSGFGWATATYRRDEVEILQPQLEALGYTDIEWLPGEVDSFGPLSRVCKASKDGEIIWFIYG
jgi:hypothetical protein